MTETTATMPTTSPDLRSHFGFLELPFTSELDARQRFEHPAFEDALQALQRAVEQRRCAALIAPAGAGKTVLLRALSHRLPDVRYRVHYVKVTSLSKRDLSREIAAAVGLEPVGTYPSLVRKLQERFDSQLNVDGMRPLILLDEGQDMRPDVLAALRLLTNFDLDSRLVLSIVIAGDPRLKTLLARPELEPFRNRIAHVATLPLLDRAQTRAYVNHRLELVNAPSSPFDNSAIDALYEISRGNPRAIDSLAIKSLELAAQKMLPDVPHVLLPVARKLLLI